MDGRDPKGATCGIEYYDEEIRDFLAARAEKNPAAIQQVGFTRDVKLR